MGWSHSGKSRGSQVGRRPQSWTPVLRKSDQEGLKFFPMGLFLPSELAQSRNQKYRGPLQHISGVTLRPTGERRRKGHPTEAATHSRRQVWGIPQGFHTHQHRL